MSKIIDLMYFVLGMWWRKVTHWLALLSGTLSIMEGKWELVLSVPLQVQHYDPGSEASQQALDQRGPLAWKISQNSTYRGELDKIHMFTNTLRHRPKRLH